MATVTLEGFREADAVLAKIPFAVRGNKLKSAMRKAGGIVRKRAMTLVPPPGYPLNRKQKASKRLAQRLGVVVRAYDNAFLTVVGPKWPARQGILVEGAMGDGSNVDIRHHSRGVPSAKGGILKKQPFLGPAARATKAAQERELIAALKKVVG